MTPKTSPLKSDFALSIVRLFWFLKLGGVKRRDLIAAIALSVLYTLCSFYVIRLLFPLAEGVVSGDFSAAQYMWGVGNIVRSFPQLTSSSTHLFILLVLWLYGATIVKNVVYYLSLQSAQVPVKTATARVRQMLIDKCLSFSKNFYDRNAVSYIQGVLTRSTGLLESQFHLFHTFLTQSLTLVIVLLVMAHISWKLMLIALVVLPIVMLCTQMFSRKVRLTAHAHNQAMINFNDRIFNLLYCMPVIKSFAKEEVARKAFADASANELDQSFRIQHLRGLSEPIEDVLATTAVLFIAFGMAMIMRLDHSLDPSKAIIFFYLTMQLKGRINLFGNFQMGVAGAASALSDIERILLHDPSLVIPEGQEKFTGLKDEIEFRGLSFRYEPEGSPILDQVTFTIKRRSIVAIVGPSGSGKSTLVNLLLRFYDCPAGTILLDGRDIRDFDISSFRKKLAFVSQEVLLFNDTVRLNLTFGAEGEISDDELRDIGSKTMINDTIDKMPQKYASSVGDRGARLSGGERQRFSITRAMVKDPEILIMDEATSALDAKMEDHLNQYLFEVAREKTVILIAHRLATVKRADKIVYLEKGHVIEQGSLQELLDKKGAFFKQWQLQKL